MFVFFLLFLHYRCASKAIFFKTIKNMVHEIRVEGVPEELYNLTQLAEVSLAAGKLPYSLPNTHVEASFCNVDSKKMSQSNDKNVSYHTLNGPTHDSCNDKILNYTTKKKWKSEWESNCYQTYEHDDYSCYSMYPAGAATEIFNTLSTQNTNAYQQMSNTMPEDNYAHPLYRTSHVQNLSSCDETSIENSRRNSLISTSPSTSISSSDEDSLYSYSHKIFDRKKIRRTTINTSDDRHHHHHQDNLTPNNSNSSSSNKCDESLSDIDTKSVRSDGSRSDEIHSCPECGKKYSTSSNLARHRQTHRYVEIWYNFLKTFIS